MQNAHISATNDIRSALTDFLKSPEIQALPTGERQSIADVADVMITELDKQEPDRGKLARWGRRLLDIAERMGVGVAASGLSHLLFG